MGILFASWWTELFFTASLLLLLYYIYFRLVLSKFWKNHNVPHMEPVFLLGNTWRGVVLENANFLLAGIHRKWSDRKLVGTWQFGSPVVMLTDLDLIKNILTRDFSHFRNRNFFVDIDREPLAGNLFNLEGAKWRNLRVRLTPTFTSGKMKMMLPTMVECGEELQEYLDKVAERGKEVEVKEILSRFTTDIISSCAFGIQANSLRNPNSEFRMQGRKLLEPTWGNMLRAFLMTTCPSIFKILNMKMMPDDMTEFFVNTVRETMETREKNGIKRNDFLQLLMELKDKGKLDDVDWSIPKELEEDEAVTKDLKFSFIEAAAQAFVFFIAGFETSATALTFALYELALNAELQVVLQQEIDEATRRHGGKLTYEGIQEMDLLDRVVQETLRKYPPAPFLFRWCNKDYEIPELRARIPKGVGVFVSILGIHRDPEIYPNPERFDPGRFTPEEKAKRHHFAYLPFGEGPRMCIGNRFALLQIKVGLASFLARHEVQVCKETPIPIKFSKHVFTFASESGMHLKVVKREGKPSAGH